MSILGNTLENNNHLSCNLYQKVHLNILYIIYLYCKPFKVSLFLFFKFNSISC